MTANLSLRQTYLYLFSMLGCVLMAIGFINLINLGLKTYIFTEADKEREFYTYQMPLLPIDEKKLMEMSENGQTLTDDEKEMIKQYLQEYKAYEEKAKNIDVVKSQRHNSASLAVSMIIVGLPLYLYHWNLIRKENKKTPSA